MPELIVKLGDNIIQKFFFDKDVLSIGRARDNDIVIENLSVSRNHARIRCLEGKFVITDLNSANGTFVNNVRVNKTELVDDDVISIGKHTILFIHKQLSDEQLISDAFGAERTMIVDKTPAARLVITKGKQKGQEFRISKAETYIGRSADNDIRLHDWFVSKKHAMILKEGANYLIKDLKSWRGTVLNGKFTTESQIKDGDNLQFGATVMTFQTGAAEPVLQLTGRVPQELHEEHIPFIPPKPGPEPGSSPEEEIEAAFGEAEPEPQEDLQERIRAEEEAVAGMRAAWEALAESDEEASEPEAGMVQRDEIQQALEEEINEEVPSPAPEPEEVSPSDLLLKSAEEPIQEEVQEQVEDLFKEEETPVPQPEPPVEEKAPVQPEPEAEPPMEETPPSPPVEERKPSRAKAKAQHSSREADPRIIAMWEKALTNPSKAIRKNAAEFLKKLTGKDYDHE
ncbi:MAG TPA: FHA domain-containing protein [Candidatus Sumerlaeota bacterium]|nr:FHA domain-containing protein [Candidatus Sumerlaeota bacterium]